MSIKSLLIGASATLGVVSGADATDANVAASAGPLEYVKVCDAFGVAYFYIPGTETCLRIGGKVRTEGQWKDPYNRASDFGTKWHTRAELDINTATNTEYGALKTESILRWDWNDGGNTATNLLWSNISLAGFTVGKTDSQYNQFVGYSGDVIQDDVIYDGPYELNQLTYNYDSGSGFTGVISLEGSNSASTNRAYGNDWELSKSGHYMPNVVAGVGYRAEAILFRVVGGYDSIVDEGAIKTRVDADFDFLQAFVMGGWNTDGNKMNQYAGSNQNVKACTTPAGVVRGADCGWGDWALWAGVGVPIDERLKWNVQLAYTDSKMFEATTNIKFNPVNNLLVEPEVTYMHYDIAHADTVSGIVRFERVF